MKYSAPAKIILIGASTGGPGQIEKIVASLPELTCTTIIIAQHMAKGFIPSFAKRLKDHSINQISMAEDRTYIKSGSIYLCDGFTTVIKNALELFFKNKAAKDDQYNPDINTVFNSCVPLAKNIEILAVILTGIGDDGVDGCKNLSLNGARCITESEQSSIVDGMPSRARIEVPNIEISNMDEIINKIKGFCN